MLDMALQKTGATTPPDRGPAGQVPFLITARGLVYEQGGQRLMGGLDLQIRAGRKTVIMGANGSGKSLLLRLLHGLVPATSGDVMWRGRPLDRAARSAQAMVFQKPVMLRRSVAANLRFALMIRGIWGRAQARRVAQALEQAQLTDLAERPARVLSGGQQQRLAIARALVCAPEVLFLDEPTSSLDPASTAHVEALIAQAHAAGITIVLVTHDRGQAQRIADDIVFLHAGQVAEAGLATQVLTTPRSAAAQAWLEGRLYLEASHYDEGS
jgi:tungstate transport system ATP-binding protein